MNKIQIIDNSLVITKEDVLVFDYCKKNVYYDYFQMNNGKIVLFDVDGVNKHHSVIFEEELISCCDKNNVVFTKQKFIDFSRKNLGSDNKIEQDINNNEQEEMISLAKNTVNKEGSIVTINSRTSTYNGNETGSSSGKHTYCFSGFKKVLDLESNYEELTTVLGSNSEEDGDQVVKSIEGNSWNSSFSSQESFNPYEQDFGIFYEIENISGTIREMGSVTSDPLASDSYNTSDYALYQVNNYLYPRVYENGIDIPTYKGNFILKTGDLVGFICINQEITYAVLRNNQVYEIYKSILKADANLFFKGSFNRGNTSSGASSIGGVRVYRNLKIDSYNVKIEGHASDLVSEKDKNLLYTEAGCEVLGGSTYSNIQFKRRDILKWKINSQDFFPIELNHSYTGLVDSVSKEINFN